MKIFFKRNLNWIFLLGLILNFFLWIIAIAGVGFI
jgi:hypothetical protein